MINLVIDRIMKTAFASSDLSGKTIGNWKVKDVIANNDITTQYSLFYNVENDNGPAIMKVLDTEKCYGDKEEGISRMELLSRETTAFHYETKVAEACASRHMSNVIRYIESGEVDLDGYAIPMVAYIVYELSEGKIGDFLKYSSKSDFVVDLRMLVEKLRSLHQVTKGVKQLHTNFIAHHNITPQSVEVFDSNSTFKLGALHTSHTDQDELQSPESRKLYNGDLTFAPPEAFFAPNKRDMGSYYQIDTYMLGNLVVYYLTQLNMTTLLNRHLPYTLKEWAKGGADYQAVLPDIINAFERVLKNIKSCICVEELQEPIMEIISCLCNPDPEKRGYPGTFMTATANADLQRVLTKLDILYKRGERLLAQYNHR